MPVDEVEEETPLRFTDQISIMFQQAMEQALEKLLGTQQQSQASPGPSPYPGAGTGPLPPAVTPTGPDSALKRQEEREGVEQMMGIHRNLLGPEEG